MKEDINELWQYLEQEEMPSYRANLYDFGLELE